MRRVPAWVQVSSSSLPGVSGPDPQARSTTCGQVVDLAHEHYGAGGRTTAPQPGVGSGADVISWCMCVVSPIAARSGSSVAGVAASRRMSYGPTPHCEPPLVRAVNVVTSGPFSTVHSPQRAWVTHG